ncbi:allantoate deiminase [Faecalicatena sp. AGMB00832]|uniref:Allantoate deiminase n=1 Tax=Faecalicatena faecalis TaxID=2726362 RepID=A0ABS6D9M0_9FIRM|nr:allantoate deiminase [Faecalicatena faecalis]MBU3878317.1 allantoate deiminase [Faecalicatena faecalis]
MSITVEEIKNVLDWISEFGKDETGGMTRLLYTESWMNAQQALKGKFEELGMETCFDAVGNLKGTLTGTEDGAGTVATGSHVDTVVNGGKLDGQLGIIGGYIAIKHLFETYGRPKKNLAVLSIAEEEGSRFPSVFWGSKNLFGIASEEEVMNIEDIDGVRFTDAMHQCGFDFADGNPSLLADTKQFVELHIEQGNTLEMEQKSVGIINGIVGQKRYNIFLKGEANHAGTTLMKYRHDVIQVYAKIVTEAVAAAKEVGDPLVLTFGKINVKPNVVNVVPGEAIFTMDVRHTDGEILNSFTRKVEELMKEKAKEEGVEIEIDCWMDEKPVPMNDKMIAVIEEACKEKGLNYRIMHSGAGHDSQIIAPRIPTGMIFVPSIRGISHNPAEDTKLKDILQGIEALELTLYKLAY